MPAPVIAIPAGRLAWGQIRGWRPGAFAVADTYIDALRRAGARPVLLTGPDPAPAEEILEPFDGLLLTGGGDLSPERYGAQPHPTLLDIEPDREDLEIGLLHAAERLGLPVLGVCRGLQLVNIAYGGTLHQHLPDVAGTVSHGEPDGGGAVTHTVEVRQGTRLASILGPTTTAIARHHQGVDRLGAGLVPTAWTEDGLIEGLERETGWVVAVQWHPEVTAASDPAQQGLFDALVAEAAGLRGRVGARVA